MRFPILMFSALLMLVSPAMAEKWPTTKFEVLNVTGSGFWAKPEVSTEPYPDEEELKKLEDFLAFSAVRLEAWGFPAPDMEVNTTARCAKCYHIYVSDFRTWLVGEDTLGYADSGGVSVAHGQYTVVNVDRGHATSADLKVVQPEAYVTVAHEMLHPILNQTKYAYDRAGDSDGNKQIGAWITEGIPDALAYYLYTEYFKQKPPGFIDSWTKFYGARAYDVPLANHEKDVKVREIDVNYASSSFWRYLAELHYKKKNGPTGSLPGPGVEPADFSYLVELLDQSHLGNSQRQEYIWLDTMLSSSGDIRQSLVYILPRFYATIAGYWDHRAQSQYTNKGSVDRDKWMLALFNHCHRLNLTTRRNSNEISIKIPELAATCLYIDVTDATSDVNVDIQVRIEADNGAELQKQLWLGTPGGQTLGKGISGPISEDVHQGVWKSQVVVKSKSPSVFILSNVAQDVASTKPVSGTLRVTMNRQSKAGELGAAPDGLHREGPRGFDDRQEIAAERALASGTALSGTAPLAMSLTVSDNEMNLKLGVSPDILNALSGSAGSGGFLDQILVSGAAMEANQALFTQAIHQAMQYNRTVPGAEVSIELPPLDYGFTGTLNNVLIRSSGGPGPDRFTVGPKDAVPGRDIRFDRSGTVTITEYSPWTLTGSYQGQLVDPNPTPAQRQQSQPVLEVVETVQGTFSVSAPWLGDERVVKDMPVDPWADMEADIANRLPPGMTDIATAVMNEAKQASQAGREPDFSSVRSAGGQSAATCDCSCAGLAALERMGAEVDSQRRAPTESERAMAACAMTCAPQYARCEAD